jgi:hypothetical protein
MMISLEVREEEEHQLSAPRRDGESLSWVMNEPYYWAKING